MKTECRVMQHAFVIKKQYLGFVILSEMPSKTSIMGSIIVLLNPFFRQ